jgi:tetratricopeptide (TPR) repeat protein
MRKIALIAIGFFGFALSVQAQTLQSAIKLTENEQFETASRQFSTLLKSQPENGDIYYFWGDNYFKSEEQDSARWYFQKGIEVAPTNPLNYAGLGKIYLHEKKAAEAQAQFDKAQKLANPKEAKVLVKIAEAWIKSPEKDLEKAATLLIMAQKLEPKNPEVFIMMGDMYLEKADGNNAIEQYNKARDLDKTSVKAILRQGQLYGRSKNYNLALEKYKEAEAIDPNFAPAYREQGELYFLSKKYDIAKQKYEKYLDLSGNLPSAQTRYGSFLFLNKEYEKAIEQLNIVLKSDTSKNNLNRLLGYSYFEVGDFEKGTRYMNRFFARAAKENTRLLSSDFEYRAKLLSKTGNDSLAIIDYEKVLEMEPERLEIYSELAALSTKAKKYDKTIYYYNKKVEAGKANGNDWFYLGRAYYNTKNFAMADSSFKQLTLVQPTLPVGYLWRAKASIQIDPESKEWLAKPHYEAFIEKTTDPSKSVKDLIEAHKYLGFYYFKNNEKEKAKEEFLAVKELDPNDEQTKKVLEGFGK